jgi:polygalacturonase
MALGFSIRPARSRLAGLLGLVGFCLVGCGDNEPTSYGPIDRSKVPTMSAAGAANGGAGAAAGMGGSSGATNGGAAGSATPSGGSGGAAVGGAGAGGGAGSAGSAGSATNYPTTCADLGKEPIIPAACATLTATKSAPGGVFTDETALDTAAIQAAITACPAGQAVKLAAAGANDAFLSGPLNLKSGVTLWIDTGVTLFASRNPRLFDAKPNQCGSATGGSSGCLPLIAANGLTGAGVMGEGTIDGRGGMTMLGQDPPLSWWQVNDQAHLDGAMSGPRLVQTSGGKDFTLYKLHIQNGPKFHVVIGTNGFVVWGITIVTDPTSPNTDGVDPSGASNGVIAYNKISTGDDNIAIKGGGPAIDNLVIAHNHFGKGHGMSIGSETNGGVKNVKVCDLSLDGTGNGLRIKSDLSRGGLVQDIHYTDVCMRSVKEPFVFDPFYSSATGTLVPYFKDIFLKNVHVLGGGMATFKGYDATHVLTMTLDNVLMDTPPTFDAQYATLTYGPAPVNFTPTGTGVTVTNNVTGTDPGRDCSAAWVTF